MKASYGLSAIWLIASIFNSCYTSTWDIKMDWGLLQKNSQHFLLREDIVFYRWVTTYNRLY
jgi:hypothetical protein